MSAQSIPHTYKTRAARLTDDLAELDVEPRIVAALEVATGFLEFAAYELAQVEDPKRISRLILLCHDMERAAHDLREGSAWPQTTRRSAKEKAQV